MQIFFIIPLIFIIFYYIYLLKSVAKQYNNFSLGNDWHLKQFAALNCKKIMFNWKWLNGHWIVSPIIRNGSTQLIAVQLQYCSWTLKRFMISFDLVDNPCGLIISIFVDCRTQSNALNFECIIIFLLLLFKLNYKKWILNINNNIFMNTIHFRLKDYGRWPIKALFFLFNRLQVLLDMHYIFNKKHQ